MTIERFPRSRRTLTEQKLKEAHRQLGAMSRELEQVRRHVENLKLEATRAVQERNRLRNDLYRVRGPLQDIAAMACTCPSRGRCPSCRARGALPRGLVPPRPARPEGLEMHVPPARPTQLPIKADRLGDRLRREGIRAP